MFCNQVGGSLGDVASDTWPSTGEIDTETQSLWLAMMNVSQDFMDSNTPGWTPQIQNAWNSFVADFTQWKDSGYFWNPGRRDELLSYRARFNALLPQMQATGIQTDVVPVAHDTPEQSGLAQAATMASDILTKGLYLVLGVGVLWAGYTVYKETRGR